MLATDYRSTSEKKKVKAKPVPHHFTYRLEHHHFGFTVEWEVRNFGRVDPSKSIVVQRKLGGM